MRVVISLISNKGGIGKTTVAVNLAAGLGHTSMQSYDANRKFPRLAAIVSLNHG
jgi:MinD superfamily P-loop ATPase